MKESKYIELQEKIREILFSEQSIVIGIGNPDRADDGAGIFVVQHWREKAPFLRKASFFLDTECSVESPVIDHLENPLIQNFLFGDTSDFGGAPGDIVLVTGFSFSFDQIKKEESLFTWDSAWILGIFWRHDRSGATHCGNIKRMDLCTISQKLKTLLFFFPYFELKSEKLK